MSCDKIREKGEKKKKGDVIDYLKQRKKKKKKERTIIQGSGIDSARPIDKITRDSIHWGGVGSVIHGGPRNDCTNKSSRAVAKPRWMKRRGGRKGKEGKARVSETRIESIKTLMLGPGGRE